MLNTCHRLTLTPTQNGKLLMSMMPSSYLIERFLILLFQYSMLVIFVQPIPDLKFKTVIMEQIPLTIHSKFIFVHMASSACYMACHDCLGKRMKFESSVNNYDYSIKGAIQLAKISYWGNQIFSLQHIWNKLNSDLYAKDATKRGSIPCDHLKDMFNKLNLNTGGGGPTSASECVTKLYLNKRNCSAKICETFRSKFFSTPLAVYYLEKTESLPSSSPISFGVLQLAYNFMLLYPPYSYRASSADMHSLTKPIPYAGWALILIMSISIASSIRLSGTKMAIFKTISVLLDKDGPTKNCCFKVCALLALWSFGCLLIRLVYCSSMYTFLTARPPPQLPSSLDEAFINKTLNTFIYGEGNAAFYLVKQPYFLENISKVHVSDNVNRNKAIECFPLGTSKYGSTVAVDGLIKDLSEFNEIKCEIFTVGNPGTWTKATTGSKFEYFT